MSTPEAQAEKTARDARYAKLRLALAVAHLRELGVTTGYALARRWADQDAERDEQRGYELAALRAIEAEQKQD